MTTAQQETKRRFKKGQLQQSERTEVRKNNWSQDRATKKSSYKEHRVDALAPYADEGRGKLRKASGSRKQALIRRYPNGETRQVKNLSLQDEYIVLREGTRRTETSKYPQEEKINNDFLSSGERTGKRPNRGACSSGLWAGIKHARP